MQHLVGQNFNNKWICRDAFIGCVFLASANMTLERTGKKHHVLERNIGIINSYGTCWDQTCETWETYWQRCARVFFQWLSLLFCLQVSMGWRHGKGNSIETGKVGGVFCSKISRYVATIPPETDHCLVQWFEPLCLTNSLVSVGVETSQPVCPLLSHKKQQHNCNEGTAKERGLLTQKKTWKQYEILTYFPFPIQPNISWRQDSEFFHLLIHIFLHQCNHTSGSCSSVFILSFSSATSLKMSEDAVDGKKSAPIDAVNIPLPTGFHTC